ncbi:MAG: DsbA family protein [Flavitalea sp.]
MALTPAVSESDHITGNVQASVVLVEYGDFECPHCGRAYPIIKKLLEDHGDKFQLVFRNFPLKKIHPHAQAAAIAAEAADTQGRFWEMHSLLFENQRNLTSRALTGYAENAGLDTDAFNEALTDEELSKKVDKHFMSGLRSGVNQTPSFFINGERFQGDWEGDDLKKALGLVSA